MGIETEWATSLAKIASLPAESGGRGNKLEFHRCLNDRFPRASYGGSLNRIAVGRITQLQER